MAAVRPRRWSKAEYYRLGELGFFQGQRVELIEGRILVLGPQTPQHANTVHVFAEVLHNLFGPGHWVRQQFPIDLGQRIEPEPDVAVVAGTRQQYQNAHPTTALLIVEVSESTPAYDHGLKASLYARGNITDYWIVNLVDRQLEVYRDPVPDPSQPLGYRYASRTDLAPPASISPLALPHASVAIAELFP